MVCNKPNQQLNKTTGVLFKIATISKVNHQIVLASLKNQIDATINTLQFITHQSITTILSRMLLFAARKVAIEATATNL